jgi:pSer/pThr/pTyr-binding forkhead associated (FHA) protein
MSIDIGVVCGACDAFNALGIETCGRCSQVLSLLGSGAPLAAERPLELEDTQPRPPQPKSQSVVREAKAEQAAPQLSEEELMEQARNYVCRECSTPVPSGHKFCGTCGATMLQGTEHIAGRDEGQILFPEDSWLSRRHANFVYENGQLVVRDERSLNGIYVRIRESVPLSFGDAFLCGEQLFLLEPPPDDTGGPSPDQTYFYSSPRKAHSFRVVQLLTGGARGLEHCATGSSVKIGREECDLNFPVDVYMSAVHARVDVAADGRFVLVDLGSKNGTYMRVHNGQPLRHGDYLFMGKQLLRVEITA